MSWKSRLAAWSPPLIAGAIILVGWESAIALISPDGFVLPPPSEILAALFDNWDEIWTAARNTGFVIVTGLIVAVLFAVVAALLVTRFRTANEIITPLAVAVNAIPIIALAPIFNAWFGLLTPRVQPGNSGDPRVLPHLHQYHQGPHTRGAGSDRADGDVCRQQVAHYA